MVDYERIYKIAEMKGQEFYNDSESGIEEFVWAGICFLLARNENRAHECFRRALAERGGNRYREIINYAQNYSARIVGALHNENWLESLNKKMRRTDFEISLIANLKVRQIEMEQFIDFIKRWAKEFAEMFDVELL